MVIEGVGNMKAVVLAGGLSLKAHPLTEDTPKPMLPVANKPLLEYLISFLKSNGIEDIIITLGDCPEKFITYFGHGEKWGVNIKYCIEPYPLGTAGCLRNARPYFDSDPFMVINGGTLMQVNIGSMISFHKENNALATIGEMQEGNSLSHIGIYVFKQKVFDFIPNTGYFDIKEQLLPLLKTEKRSVYSFQLTGYCNGLFTIPDYMHANGDILQNKIMAWEDNELNDSSKIEPNVAPLESTVIGNNCNIHESVKFIGPLAIGNNCNIEEGVIVNNSIIWSDCHLKKGATVNHCFIGRGCCIPRNADVSNMAFFGKEHAVGSINIAMRNHRKQRLTIVMGRCNSLSKALNILRLKLFRVAKRVADICISLIGLILAAPIFALISLAIKIDSKGPIFFIEKRKMSKNKEFSMIKFRSMVAGADKIQGQLMHLNEVDGPMFKIENDPRLTRVGKFIALTNLDELPQLLNVLRSQMSLVGPRPLAEREMKYNPYWKDARLTVKQGLTGAWQSDGKRSLFPDWIRHDVSYVKNQSFWLDIKILFRTVLLVIVSIERALKS